MTQSNIRAALEQHLAALSPAMPTAYQNAEFAPVANTAYQEAFVLPVRPRTIGLRQKRALHTGIFQVNLCYPAASGAGDAEARAGLLVQHFRPEDTTLEFGGTKVTFSGFGEIAGPVPGRPGLFILPVSFRYKSIF